MYVETHWLNIKFLTRNFFSLDQGRIDQVPKHHSGRKAQKAAVLGDRYVFQRGGVQDEVLQHMQPKQMLWTREDEHEASLVHLPREEEVLEAGHVHQDLQVSQDEGLPVHVNPILKRKLIWADIGAAPINCFYYNADEPILFCLTNQLDYE